MGGAWGGLSDLNNVCEMGVWGRVWGTSVPSQSYREMPSCWSSLTKLCSKGSGIPPLPFEHSFVSELQQEGISRYDCDSQKCDIALRAICLKTFGGRSFTALARSSARAVSCLATSPHAPLALIAPLTGLSYS